MVQIGSKTMTVDGVTVMADHADPNQFWYLPNFVQLARRPQGDRAEFTLIKFGDIKDNKVTGKGFLMFKVNLQLDPKLERKIKSRLASLAPDRPILTVVPFDSGTVQCIALNLQGSGGTVAPVASDGSFQAVESILGATVPSLHGNNEAAFSLTLSKEGATIMESAFKQETTPVGVLYSMKYTALRPALDVEITANFKRIYDYFNAGLSAKYMMFQVGIDAGFQKLVQEGVIQIKVINYSDASDRAEKENWALNFFKEKLLNEWFTPSLTPPFAETSPTETSNPSNTGGGGAGTNTGNTSGGSGTSTNTGNTSGGGTGNSGGNALDVSTSSGGNTATNGGNAPDVGTSSGGNTATNGGNAPDVSTSSGGNTATNGGNAPDVSTSSGGNTATSGGNAPNVSTSSSGGNTATTTSTPGTTGGNNSSGGNGGSPDEPNQPDPTPEEGQAGSGLSVTFKLKYVKQIEDKKITLRYNRTEAIQCTHTPQGFFGLLTQDLDRAKHFIEVDGDDEFFREFTVSVETPFDKDRINLVSAHLQLDYGDLNKSNRKRKDFVIDKTSPERLEWMVKMIPGQMKYRYLVQYHFNPTSSWIGDQLSYELPAITTEDRTLMIHPFDRLAFLEIEVSPSLIDWEFVSSVEAQLSFKSAKGWSRKEVLNFTEQNQDAKTLNLRLGDPSARTYSTEFIYRLKNGNQKKIGPEKTSATKIAIPNPFYLVELELIPFLSEGSIRMVYIDIEYKDTANAYVFSKKITIDGTATDSVREKLYILDPAKRTYQYKLTIIGQDGSMKRGQFIKTDETILIVKG